MSDSRLRQAQIGTRVLSIWPNLLALGQFRRFGRVDKAEAKATELWGPITTNQDVVALDIPMNDSLVVEVHEPLSRSQEELPHVALVLAVLEIIHKAAVARELGHEEPGLADMAPTEHLVDV